MKATINLLGNTSAEVKYVFARHSSWNGLVQNSDARANNEKRVGKGTELGYVDSGNYNYYEGCCLFQGKWWMGGLGTSRTSGYYVLIHVSLPNNSNTNDRQAWRDMQDNFVPYPSGTLEE